ncbi:MAG: cobU [Firmicutes bacterium]|nr:cobU [Bacillota bacterium]
MAGKIVLVTGGARSGKSTFAERYVAALNTSVAYIATAEVLDEEMVRRVSLHQERRPAEWCTFEAPYDAEVVLKEVGQNTGAVLFDCLTLYISNFLLTGENLSPGERLRTMKQKIASLVESAKTVSATVVFVTNEVGLGIVPDNVLAREFRDCAGIANQMVAAAADEVYLVVCGLATEIKKNALVFR